MISRTFRPCIFLGLEANVILYVGTSSTGCVTGSASRAGISRSQASGLTAGPDCLSQSFVQICALNLSVLHDENHCGFYAEALPLSLKRLRVLGYGRSVLLDFCTVGTKSPSYRAG